LKSPSLLLFSEGNRLDRMLPRSRVGAAGAAAVGAWWSRLEKGGNGGAPTNDSRIDDKVPEKGTDVTISAGEFAKSLTVACW
jgi:hypothetical protein